MRGPSNMTCGERPMLSLRDLQSRFFYSIARPVSSDDEEWQGFDPLLVQAIQTQGPLGPQDRLDIYAQMYCARLLDALLEDFPRIAAIVGEDRFRDLGRAYLRHHPSTQPSLKYLSVHFAEFLATQTVGTSLPFLCDLARLERTRVDVFGAPDGDVLRLDDLQNLPPEAWATVRFRVIPALTTLTCAWPVQRVWKEESFTASDELEPAPTVLRVWRQDFAVYHASMDAVEQAALKAMQAGESFAAVCGVIEPLVTTDDVSTTVGSLLLRWVEDGIIARGSATAAAMADGS